MSDMEPTPIHGIVDLGHTFIKCPDCDTEHVDIWKTKESSRVTVVKVICENEGCGGESFNKEITGEFYIGGTEYSRFVSIDQDQEDYVEIHSKSIED